MGKDGLSNIYVIQSPQKKKNIYVIPTKTPFCLHYKNHFKCYAMEIKLSQFLKLFKEETNQQQIQ